jgi:chorismate dehydratase
MILLKRLNEEKVVIFGSISYLNLLPFQVYLKRRVSSSQQKQMIEWHKAVPSSINKKLKCGKVDSAFISSIHSRDYRCTNLGIVADGAVYSVFVISGRDEDDEASATSNVLAKILNIKGRVLIGDEALKYYLEGGEGVDLSLKWKEMMRLPFVFAMLCYNRKGKKIKKIARGFKVSSWKIPQYILKREAKRRGISPNDLKWYLKFIKYEITHKESKSLKLFYRKLRRF